MTEMVCPKCGVERTDYERPNGAFLPKCPNCGSTEDPCELYGLETLDRLIDKRIAASVLDENSLLVINYPRGTSVMLGDGQEYDNGHLANILAKRIREDNHVSLPTGWSLQVIQRKPGYAVETKESAV